MRDAWPQVAVGATTINERHRAVDGPASFYMRPIISRQESAGEGIMENQMRFDAFGLVRRACRPMPKRADPYREISHEDLLNNSVFLGYVEPDRVRGRSSRNARGLPHMRRNDPAGSGCDSGASLRHPADHVVPGRPYQRPQARAVRLWFSSGYGVAERGPHFSSGASPSSSTASASSSSMSSCSCTASITRSSCS
jgi:hypothetical protein